jgi:subtilisin family serine protease
VVDASNGVSSASAMSGATGVGDFGSTKVTIENRIDSPPNGGTHIRIEINSLSLLPWNITLTRTTAGGDGRVDGYVGSESGSFLSSNITLNPDGSVPGTITEPATSAGAIAAGAYRELFTWDRESAGTYIAPDGIGSGVAGNIAPFSSRGPTRDGRQKPDVAAPGAYVGGARSADSSPTAQTVDPDGVHVYGEGTSFAAPEVTGALALLMQKNRIHTSDEIKGLLASTALTDGFVTPGNAWGPGKLNATDLLSSVVTEVDVKARAGRCQSAAGAPAEGLVHLACLGAALLVLALRRKS